MGFAPLPRDVDAAVRVGYLSDRGPAGGFDANYGGGFLTDTTKQPWNFEGSFRSYFVYDHGSDDIGRLIPANPDDNYRLRGYVAFEHQHFFPDDWQLQLRANWVSDQEFLEQYFPRSFDTDLPHDESFYLKHQKDNEAFTLLYQFQPNGLVTSSDYFQNRFEVEHIPEIGYQRLGDSLAGDQLTLYSQNTLGGLHFQHTRASLDDEGFKYVSPGIASLGTTGTTDKIVYRGDFREELDYPIDAGPFKVTPYVMGGYTGYSNSPEGGAKNRFLGGMGGKITTAFWKVDDTVQSDLFDLHRLRHVIEPEVNLFTSAETVHRSEVYQFDDSTDPVNDISAASIVLHQRLADLSWRARQMAQRGRLQPRPGGGFLCQSAAQEGAQPVRLPGAVLPLDAGNLPGAQRGDRQRTMADQRQHRRAGRRSGKPRSERIDDRVGWGSSSVAISPWIITWARATSPNWIQPPSRWPWTTR